MLVCARELSVRVRVHHACECARIMCVKHDSCKHEPLRRVVLFGVRCTPAAQARLHRRSRGSRGFEYICPAVQHLKALSTCPAVQHLKALSTCPAVQHLKALSTCPAVQHPEGPWLKALPLWALGAAAAGRASCCAAAAARVHGAAADAPGHLCPMHEQAFLQPVRARLLLALTCTLALPSPVPLPCLALPSPVPLPCLALPSPVPLPCPHLYPCLALPSPALPACVLACLQLRWRRRAWLSC